MPYSTKTSRASPVTSPKALNRIQSEDGSRWAYSRARKLCSTNGRYEIVQSWVCKACVNGKAVTVTGDAFESAAREFVKAI
jgi:hypothetical protein